MPRYAFTVIIDTDAPAEPYIRSLDDADAAWEAARAMIVDLMTASADPRLLSAIMVVTDEADEIVFEFPFSEALNLPAGGTGPVH
ncbi:hypothetical protein J2X36_003477 [Methylobacterium sp. BE186]|nr:hypothetical protein [Methylobacterium sp. BE186]MDR7038707.1 hypothetical protein [Methylobacterium sp. BE186]